MKVVGCKLLKNEESSGVSGVSDSQKGTRDKRSKQKI